MDLYFAKKSPPVKSVNAVVDGRVIWKIESTSVAQKLSIVRLGDAPAGFVSSGPKYAGLGAKDTVFVTAELTNGLGGGVSIPEDLGSLSEPFGSAKLLCYPAESPS